MAVSLVALLAVSLIVVPLLTLVLLATKSPPKRATDDERRLPPSPPGALPLLGHLHQLGRLPHRALRSLAASHGPVILLRFGGAPTMVVSSAAAAEEALRGRDAAFASRPRSAMADRLVYGSRDITFAPYGEYWRQARRICAVHVLSHRRTASFRRVRDQEAAALVARVRAESATGGGVVNLSDALFSYSKAVVTRAAFGDGEYGLDGDEGGEKLRRMFADLQELLMATPMREIAPWLGWVDTLTGLDARATRTFDAIDGVLERVIADHRAQRRPGGQRVEDDDDHRDFVDVLLDVNEMDKDTGFRLDTDNIKAIIMDMFVAGTDTSYTVLEWAMAELLNHPDKMRKLQAEIRAAAGGTVTEDHLGGLPYLKAVISETLAAAGAPGDDGGHGAAGVPRPVAHPRPGQRLGHRPGPGPVGPRGGVRAGAVRRRRPAAGVQQGRAGPEVPSVRRGKKRVPRRGVRRAVRGAGACQRAVPLRLGVADDAEGASGGHGRSVRADCEAEGAAAACC
ncbi:unnamed protein product [Urochloa humidicola]